MSIDIARPPRSTASFARKVAAGLLITFASLLGVLAIILPTRGRPTSMVLVVGMLAASSATIYFASRMKLGSAAVVLVSFFAIQYLVSFS